MNRSQAATNREVPVSKTIPYRSHVSPYVVNTEAGDLVTVFKVSGVAHESADVEDVDSWHTRLNGLLKTIQSPNVTLWTHTIRQKRGEYPQGDFVRGSFAAEVDGAYRGRVTQTEMMANDLYVTVVYSPNENKLKKLVAKIFDRLDPAEVRAKVEDALEAIEDVARQVKAGLGEWGPVRLGWYEEDGVTYSEVMELFGYLLNMEWQRWPVPRLNPGVDTTIAGVLATARPFMGAEAFEIRGATKSRVGGILALKEYPAWTSPGFVNKLLSLPCEFILTQSFRFIPKQAALGMLVRQQSKMVQSGEVSDSLVQQMNDALDHLSAGRFVMGEHHLSLTLLAGTVKELNDNIAEAKSNLSDCGGVPAREDWGLEAAFWAQLPGNFRWRSRPAPVTSFNFAGFCAMHNYPTGLAAGNQWGPAVTMFKTASGTPYYFNFHLPPKKRKRGRDALRQVEVKVDDRVAGNTLIIGPTGSGKTVVQTLLLAQLEKFKPTIFYYDKDRGMEIFFRALGGNYLTIENGIPTGFNPFRIEPNAGNVSFLQTIVRKLVKAGGDVHLTPVEEKDIDNAIDGVLGLPEEMRRLGSMLQFMDPTDPAGPAARLERWCAGGALGWVFDNEVDEIDPNKNRINGFDITDLLDNDQVREPVLMYLLHRQEEVIDGRRVVLGFDEGWKVLYDEWLSAYVENKELTIRKQDGFVIFGTQNPSHVIKSRIADTLVQQSVTQIYMPNDKASREDYINGFKLSEREYEIIKDVMPAMPGRYFLVKQGKHSAICELDLAGLDNILAVLSGTTSTVELLNHIRAELGPDCTPADWLPVFHERRKLS